MLRFSLPHLKIADEVKRVLQAEEDSGWNSTPLRSRTAGRPLLIKKTKYVYVG